MVIGERLDVPAPKHEGIHQYEGYRRGEPAFCDVAFWQDSRGTIIVLTERPDNHGLSITNGAEYIAAEVIAEHEIDGMVTVVEHYPDSLRIGKSDTWDRVLFDSYKPRFAPVGGVNRWTLGCEPDWRHMQRSEVEALIRGDG